MTAPFKSLVKKDSGLFDASKDFAFDKEITEKIRRLGK